MRSYWVLLIAMTMWAQDARPAFEVSSVKPAGAVKGIAITPRRSGDRISYLTQFDIALFYAYSVQPFQVVGADLQGVFDIEAVAGKPVDDRQIKLMLQTLLAERFKLELHHQTKEMTVYTLVAEATPQLKPAEDPSAAGGRVYAFATKLGPRLQGKNASMAQLAEGLARVMRSPVIDQTGIAGTFDFDVECNSDPSDIPSSVLVALRKLGLRVKAGKAPVDILVVDHVEQPSGN